VFLGIDITQLLNSYGYWAALSSHPQSVEVRPIEELRKGAEGLIGEQRRCRLGVLGLQSEKVILKAADAGRSTQ